MLLPILIGSLGAWLGFANPVHHLVGASLLYPLSLCWIALRAQGPKQAFKTGWVTGALACLGCLYWFFNPLYDYGNIPWFLAVPAPILASMYLGLYPALFTLGMYPAIRSCSALGAVLTAGLLWASVEMLQSILLTGFPWMTLSASLAPWPQAIQLASLTGAFLLSGIFASLACALVFLVRPPSRGRYMAFLLVVLIPGVIFGWGRHRLEKTWEEDDGESVCLVQGNVDQSLKWDESYQQETVDRYIRLSRLGIRESAPSLLVWPETALPFHLQDPVELSNVVQSFVRESGVPLVTGSPAYHYKPENGDYIYYNRAFLVPTSGRIEKWYDKEHLVPLGEYVPLKQIITWLPVERLVQSAGDFQAGRDQAPLVTGDLSLGLLICYESIFPGLARERVTQGANLLVNISNDAWFGRSSAPRQHLNLAVLRAVEQNRYLLRGTNTGISAIIDPRGRLTGRTKLFAARTLCGKAIPLREKTVYHALQPYLRWAVWLLTLALVTVAARRTLRQGARLEISRKL